MIQIRRIGAADGAAVWRIWQEVIREGDAFYSDESTSQEKVISTWTSGASWVALIDQQVCGAYSIFPLRHGRAAHVADACYMVGSDYRRRGVGKTMGLHSLEQAKALGFLAMQFDCVVSTNQAALALWRQLGFRVCGTVPDAFRHPSLGLVDIVILHRFL